MVPLSRFILGTANMRLDVFIADNNVVVFGELFKLDDQLGRIGYVNDEHAEKQADHKRKSQILR